MRKLLLRFLFLGLYLTLAEERVCAQTATLLHVPTNAALASTPISTANRIMRDGFYSAGDGGAAVYTASGAACSPAADNGVRVSASGGCWIMDTNAIQPNILQWGAKADDTTDIGPYIQLAYNANIGPIHIPAGVYFDNTQAVFATNTVPYFFGDGWAEYNQVAHCPAPANIVGTWIHFKVPVMAQSPFYWNGASGQVASGHGGFHSMAFCQDHPTPVTNWTPITYQPIFLLSNIGGITEWENLYFYGIYDGFSIYNTAQIHFSNIKGQVFHKLLTGPNGYVDALYDLSQGRDFHIWPFWSYNTNVLKWTESNGIVFDIARMDSFQVDNFFAFGYKSCLKLERSVNGSPNQLQFGTFLCDATQFGIWATSTPGIGGTAATVSFANVTVDAIDLESSLGVPETECVRSDGGGGSVIKISNLSCLGTTYSGVIAASTTGGDDIEIGFASMGAINCHGLTSCPGGSSPIFYTSNSAGQNLIKIAAPAQIQALNGGGIFNTDVAGIYNTNGIFQYPNGYSINIALPTTGGALAMGNFTPISLLFIHSTATITGAVTVILPSAGQDEAIITPDVDITNLTLSSSVGGGALPSCPHSLAHQHSLIIKWFNFGPAATWRCIAS